MTYSAANNLAISLYHLQRFEESKALFRKTIPVARRVLGEGQAVTLKLRARYAMALYHDDDATLDDLREAVATLEDTVRVARRFLGSSHPFTAGTEDRVRHAQATLSARETPQEGA